MKNTSTILCTIILVTILLFNGCATIIKGTSQDISISSNPTSASYVVKTTGGIEMFNGTTPGTVKLSKKKEYIVTVSLKGYKDTNVPITQSFETWTIGNILCGGLLGLIVDAVDGAMWKLEPEMISVNLATAYNGNNEPQYYAVFRALDNNGEVRSLSVPLIKDNTLSSN